MLSATVSVLNNRKYWLVPLHGSTRILLHLPGLLLHEFLRELLQPPPLGLSHPLPKLLLGNSRGDPSCWSSSGRPWWRRREEESRTLPYHREGGGMGIRRRGRRRDERLIGGIAP
ncbi:unnamed protein product [Musa banksii]